MIVFIIDCHGLLLFFISFRRGGEPNPILEPIECKANIMYDIVKNAKENNKKKPEIDSHKVQLNLVNNHKHAHHYHHHPQTF